MFKGAKQLPTMHISVRVPWHDQKWSGKVCANPRGNTSCLALQRIAKNKDDEFETSIADTEWNTEGGRLPACAAERGAFMAPFGYTRSVPLPHGNDPRYAHFRKSSFYHPPFSAATVPFAWMMKNSTSGIPDKAKINKIDIRTEREPAFDIKTWWLEEHHNQLAMLDTFFGAITPQESLVFFYAKNTPLTEGNRRVIVGVGRVLKIDSAVEYTYAKNTPPNALRYIIWDRNLHHSIRPEVKDGFLLPYHDLIDLAAQDPSINLSNLALHVPEEHRDAFSMGAEHVTHDQAITILLSCSSLLEKIKKIVPGNWSSAQEWINTQLNRIWRLRGAFPGLGSSLTAFGLKENGTLVAHAIGQQLHADGSQEVRDPWPLVEKVLHEPTVLSNDLAMTIGPTIAQLWDDLKPERMALLKLLARFEITADQATRWFDPGKRSQAGIKISDSDILANPYLCFEEDRMQIDPISATVIDHGLFPDATIATKIPVPKPSHCGEAIDPRRVRALMVTTLDRAVNNEGHTLLPQSHLVQRICDFDITPQCAIGADWIGTFDTFLKEKMNVSHMVDGTPAWQLKRYMIYRRLISTRVKRLLADKRHSGDYDWRACIDQQFPPFKDVSDSKTEESARREKACALEKIYRSRFSVLIGPAGTGKTSLVTALLSLPTVKNGGILLLAPTGKARVQMQKRVTNTQVHTLAQFLLKFRRYKPNTGIYHLSKKGGRESGFKTVVIDECSMLTEDQFAATLDAIETTTIERLILVGDPRQLPPIGAGRPFVDIIRYLTDSPAEENNQTLHGYAELKIVRRQIEEESLGEEQLLTNRDDIILSKWFGGETPDPSADEAWSRLESGKSKGIKAIRWENDNDLQEKILDEIKATTKAISRRKGFDEEREDAAFEISLGGRPSNDGKVYFDLSNQQEDATNFDNRTGGGADAEAWQILSPIRAGETGVDGLNRSLQKFFRRQVRSWAEPEQYQKRMVCKPMGTQGILYGDKVINTINGEQEYAYPSSGRGYLANGEIGTVVGQYRKVNWKWPPSKIEVEFSSQLGSKYRFSGRDFSDESGTKLELAYALTIHKSQGSEFGITFVVMPNPCRLLSRELLYTALTRQREEVVLLHQGELRELLKLSLPKYSETARRLTNLFSDPNPVEHAGVFLEEGLIHCTTRGEFVRSKSEVIIANLLHKLEISYAYEQPFIGKDGSVRYPDFTIEDARGGRRIFLEHLGISAEPAYQRRWQAKLDWYRSQGVSTESEEEGEGGILITTTEENGINSADIERKLLAILTPSK